MKATRVFFAFPQNAFLRDYEPAYLPLVQEELRKYGPGAGFALAESAKQADLIVFLQSAQYKTREYIKILENDPLVRAYADRVFVIDYDDHPEGMLPGLYTSIESPFFEARLHRSWPILLMNNPAVYELKAEDVFKGAPQRLFSFVGAASHDVRRRIVELFNPASPHWHVELIGKWYNHTDADRTRFVNIALDSLFCLCPRGYASYTNRIAEVMAMGRVPVVIADDWVPFSFSDDRPYFVRVAEKDVERLPDILAAERGRADELRHNARKLWEQHCSLPHRVVRAVESIRRLSESLHPRPTFSEYQERWHSPSFLRMCGWTLRQRIALRLRQRLARLGQIKMQVSR